MGLGPSQAFFSLTSELTTQVSRPSVLWISGVIFWIVSTLIALVFPYMLEAMESYSFIPFAFVSLLEILYIHFAVPDAHNRSVEEIQTDFARRASGVKRKQSTGSGINNPSFELKTVV
uniref:Major facilitator superfamily (MFS) profile domain-containing protein n=1 Tax=Ciona savignyi TaxID=51511 RepID=H2YDP7_CIOSA